MNPRRHLLLRDTLDFLRANGATDIRYERGGKHIKVSAIYQGCPIRTTLSVSPSKQHAVVQSIALLKRQLRAAEARS